MYPARGVPLPLTSFRVRRFQIRGVTFVSSARQFRRTHLGGAMRVVQRRQRRYVQGAVGKRFNWAQAAHSAAEALEDRKLLTTYFVNMTGQTPDDVPGYMMDVGAAFGDRTDRGNAGVSYGWIDSSTGAPVDNTANGRNRNSATLPPTPGTPINELYDSFNHMQKQTPSRSWEIAIPNGTYQVHLASA